MMQDDDWISELPPLVRAAYRNNLDAVRKMLESGVDPDIDDNGYSALHAAAPEGSVEMIELLLDAGADPNFVDDLGWTPIHKAARGNPDALKLLIERGGGVNAVTDDWAGTPLELAAECGSLDCVVILHEAGARITDDVLFTAAESGATEIVRYLLERESNLDKESAAAAAERMKHAELAKMIHQWNAT